MDGVGYRGRTGEGKDEEEEGAPDGDPGAPRHKHVREALAVGELEHEAVHEHDGLRDAEDEQRLAADEGLDGAGDGGRDEDVDAVEGALREALDLLAEREARDDGGEEDVDGRGEDPAGAEGCRACVCK